MEDGCQRWPRPLMARLLILPGTVADVFLEISTAVSVSKYFATAHPHSSLEKGAPLGLNREGVTGEWPKTGGISDITGVPDSE